MKKKISALKCSQSENVYFVGLSDGTLDVVIPRRLKMKRVDCVFSGISSAITEIAVMDTQSETATRINRQIFHFSC